LPAEMLPDELNFGGISFHLGPADKANAIVPRGQTIAIPANTRRLYLLAASANDDQKATFRVGSEATELTIQNWGGFIGQWDDRQWKRTEVQIPPRTPPPDTPPDIAALLQRTRTRVDPYGEMIGITPGFIKRAPLAWFASHHHTVNGTNDAYAYSYLFAYELDVPANATTLTLPNNDQIRILAITGSNEAGRVKPAHPLYGL
jgi:alpha-mannosidase